MQEKIAQLITSLKECRYVVDYESAATLALMDSLERPLLVESEAGIGTGVDVFKSYDADTVGIGAGAGRQTTITKADFRFLDNRNAMRQVEVLADHLLAAHSLDALRRYVRVMNV